MPRRKTRRGGRPGNVTPSITGELMTIDREVDEILAIPWGRLEVVRSAFEDVKRLTVHRIRIDDNYPLPTLVTYHDSCVSILRSIRPEIDVVLSALNSEDADYLDERVSAIMRALHRIKTILPRSRTRARSRSRSRSRSQHQV